ncbi:MAG: CHAT domain-containing protein [Pseudanabaenaceae cyanobacterium bins.39]|nr:CHAT domain-containing protein [Pseudanabaenaceae cyanobacterium bins.39]
MATTLAFLEDCLRELGRNFATDQESDRILTELEGENLTGKYLSLQLTESGEFLQFVIPQLLNLANCAYLEAVLETLVSMGYEYKLVRFEYDPSDGEVRASVELPLEDADLTVGLFTEVLTRLERTLNGLVMPRLQRVMVTGVDESENNPANLIAQMGGSDFLERMNAVQQAIEQTGELPAGVSPRELLQQLTGIARALGMSEADLPEIPTIPRIETDDPLMQFWVNLLQAEAESGGNDEAVHRVMQQNLHLVTIELGSVIAPFVELYLSQNPDEAAEIVGLVENVCTSIRTFPNSKHYETAQISIIGYNLVLERRQNDPPKYAQTLTNLGNAYLTLSELGIAPEANLGKAVEVYEKSFSIRDPQILPVECIKTGKNLSRLYVKQKYWQKTLRVCLRTIAAAQNLRTINQNDQDRQKVMEDVISIYATAIEAYIALGDYPAAISLAESSRSRYLVELMAANDLYKDGEIAPEIREWMATHKPELEKLWEEYNQIGSIIEIKQQQEGDGEAKQLATTGTKRDPDSLKKTIAEISQLQARRDQLWQRMRQLDPIFAGKLEVTSPDYQAMQTLIDRPTTAILYIYTTNDNTYLFVLCQDQNQQPQLIRHECQGLGRDALRQWLIDNWLIPYLGETAVWRESIDQRLAQLAEMLQINKLTQKLTQPDLDIQELVIIPHLLLHMIPFGALPIDPPQPPLSKGGEENAPLDKGQEEKVPLTKGDLGGSHLSDHFEKIRYAPSAQILQYCQERNPINPLKRGSVEDATSDLFFAQLECDIIAQTYQIPDALRLKGQAATVAEFQKLVINGKLQHLHSSHHAAADLMNSMQSALKLADGEVTTGQLMTPPWAMPDLDEVFLSCCETNLGLPRASDDLITLGTGFLTAGARAVISTLWSVDAIATAFFCAFYYDERKGENGDRDGEICDRPTAIHRAQTKLRTATSLFLVQYLNTKLLAAKAQNNQALIESINGASKVLAKYIKENPKGCPFASPFYWSAFICQGLR